MTVSLIKLGFIGTYKVDMLLFIARILAKMNLKVIIVDSSEEAYLYDYIGAEAYEQLIYGKDIDFYVGDMPDYLEKVYDVALCDYGLNSNNIEYFINCQWRFMITNPEKHNIIKLSYFSNIMRNYEDKHQLIKVYRDMVSGKIDSAYLDFTLLIDSVYDVIASYCFDLEIDDYKYRLHNAYDEQTILLNQSKQYMMFYQDLMEELLDEKTRTIKKAIKKTRKGVVVA